MEYLVSIEDTNYHWWQIELLIESFKAHGLEDKLVVALAENESPKFLDFSRNLRGHERKFMHPNHGRTRNLLGLNRAYACIQAQVNKLVKQPFCLIDPDMLLFKPVPEPDSHITFQLRWSFSQEEVERNGLVVEDQIQSVLRERKLPDKRLWLPLGSVYTFKDVPLDLFHRAVMWGERLELERQKRLLKQKANAEPWWETPRAGWVMAMVDYYGSLSMKPVTNYEMSLIDTNVSHNFVHYQHGLPPVWSKIMYRYEPPVVLCMGGSNPFDVLLEHNPTTTTNYVQSIIRSYQKGEE